MNLMTFHSVGKNHPNWLIYFFFSQRGWNHQPVFFILTYLCICCFKQTEQDLKSKIQLQGSIISYIIHSIFLMPDILYLFWMPIAPSENQPRPGFARSSLPKATRCWRRWPERSAKRSRTRRSTGKSWSWSSKHSRKMGIKKGFTLTWFKIGLTSYNTGFKDLKRYPSILESKENTAKYIMVFLWMFLLQLHGFHGVFIDDVPPQDIKKDVPWLHVTCYMIYASYICICICMYVYIYIYIYHKSCIFMEHPMIINQKTGLFHLFSSWTPAGTRVIDSRLQLLWHRWLGDLSFSPNPLLWGIYWSTGILRNLEKI